MNLQIIKDGSGNDTGVFVPMSDWEAITQKHEDLKSLLPKGLIPSRKVKFSELAGSISKETGAALLKHVEEIRDEWNERAEKQLR